LHQVEHQIQQDQAEIQNKMATDGIHVNAEELKNGLNEALGASPIAPPVKERP